MHPRLDNWMVCVVVVLLTWKIIFVFDQSARSWSGYDHPWILLPYHHILLLYYWEWLWASGQFRSNVLCSKNPRVSFLPIEDIFAELFLALVCNSSANIITTRKRICRTKTTIVVSPKRQCSFYLHISMKIIITFREFERWWWMNKLLKINRVRCLGSSGGMGADGSPTYLK